MTRLLTVWRLHWSAGIGLAGLILLPLYVAGFLQ